MFLGGLKIIEADECQHSVRLSNELDTRKLTERQLGQL